MNEALKFTRVLFLSSILVYIFWFLAFPSLTENMKKRESVRHFISWLLLNELFQNSSREINNDFDNSVLSPYPNDTRFYIGLEKIFEKDFFDGQGEREGTTQIFAIKAFTFSFWTSLPLDHYVLVIRNFEDSASKPNSGIYPKIWIENDQFDMEEALFRSKIYSGSPWDSPPYWPEIKAGLEKYVNEKIDYKKLTSQSSSVIRYLKDTSENSYTIFGLYFSFSFIFVAFGWIVGSLGLGMIGPIAALKKGNSSEITFPWFLVAVTSNSLSGILETSLCLVGLTWTITPIAIGLSQLAGIVFLDVELTKVENIILYLGLIPILFTTIVQRKICIRLGMIRLSLQK